MLFPLNNRGGGGGGGGGVSEEYIHVPRKKRGGGIVNSVLICLLSRLIDLVIDWLNVKWKVLEMRSFYDLK